MATMKLIFVFSIVFYQLVSTLSGAKVETGQIVDQPMQLVQKSIQQIRSELHRNENNILSKAGEIFLFGPIVKEKLQNAINTANANIDKSVKKYVEEPIRNEFQMVRNKTEQQLATVKDTPETGTEYQKCVDAEVGQLSDLTKRMLAAARREITGIFKKVSQQMGMCLNVGVFGIESCMKRIGGRQTKAYEQVLRPKYLTLRNQTAVEVENIMSTMGRCVNETTTKVKSTN